MIAQIAIVAIIMSLSVVADYQVFVDRWNDEDFFNSGTFMGKALVEVSYVVYLILMIAQVRNAVNGS